MRARLRHVLWRVKVVVQFVLAHVPLGEKVNYALQEAQGARNPELLRSRIRELVVDLAFLDAQARLAGATVVEVGTGWDAVNTVLLALFGAGPIHTYDHVRHVRFQQVRRVLAVAEGMVPEIAEAGGLDEAVVRARLREWRQEQTLDALFASANIVYSAPGDACATGLADHSVDLYYSHQVLEHVSEAVVHCLTTEAKRVLKPSGNLFHWIGEGDHYTSVDPSLTSVNFLKYPEWLWRLLVKNKISYHNRMREPQFLAIFAEHGANLRSLDSRIDDRDLAALRTMKIDKRFAGYSDRDLAVATTRVLLTFG